MLTSEGISQLRHLELTALNNRVCFKQFLNNKCEKKNSFKQLCVFKELFFNSNIFIVAEKNLSNCVCLNNLI